MTVAPELVWLIERLRSTPSRRERLRLLLEAWRTIQNLSRADRLLVARELGIDGAEQLVEEIAQRRGTSIDEILGALRRDDDSETPKLGGLLRGLVDPTRRGSTIDRLLDAASAWVADLDTLRTAEPMAEHRLPETPELAVDVPVPVEGPADDEQEVEFAVPPALPSLPDEPGELEQAVQPPGEGPAELAEEAPTEAEPAAAADAEVAGSVDDDGLEGLEPVESVEGVQAVGLPEAADELEVDAPPPKVAEPASVEQPDPAPLRVADPGAVVGELEARRSLSGRLAELPRRLPELIGAGGSELSGLIESFPEGWARRRALEALLRSDLPADLAEALALVDCLDRPSERMWALTAIAATRDLSAQDEEALLAAADTRAIRRRLKLRIRQRAGA